MSDFDFRKAYAAEVKASAESKKRCNDLIEWTELQRQTAISSHAGQLRNTLAFKAEVELLVKALEKVRSYNVDIAAGRINYRPHDHIQVIDEALACLSGDPVSTLPGGGEP